MYMQVLETHTFLLLHCDLKHGEQSVKWAQLDRRKQSIITCYTLTKRERKNHRKKKMETSLTDKFTFNNCPGISNYVWFGKLIHVSLAAIFILASFQINIY